MFFKIFQRGIHGRRIYLDYAASTPIDHRMLRSFAVLPAADYMGNPGALHREGIAAKRVLTDARTRIASCMRAHPDEIIFTSGATESNNLALAGLVRAWQTSGVPAANIEIITTEREHPSVIETVKALGSSGVTVTFLPVGEDGFAPSTISPLPGKTHVLVTCMYVHNELGTISPLKEIAKRIRFLKKHNPSLEIVFHTDATQAPNTLAIDIPTLGVDLLSLGSTKLYTQKGVGMLYRRRGVVLQHFLYGGGQEYGLVPGTEAVFLVDLFAKAFVYAQTHVETVSKRLSSFQSYFESRIRRDIPRASIDDAHLDRSAHITHLSIPQFDSELLVIELDARGIATSSQSACTDIAPPDSYMKKRFGDTTGLIRFSFGRMTKRSELDQAIEALKSVIQKYAAR